MLRVISECDTLPVPTYAEGQEVESGPQQGGGCPAGPLCESDAEAQALTDYQWSLVVKHTKRCESIAEGTIRSLKARGIPADADAIRFDVLNLLVYAASKVIDETDTFGHRCFHLKTSKAIFGGDLSERDRRRQRARREVSDRKAMASAATEANFDLYGTVAPPPQYAWLVERLTGNEPLADILAAEGIDWNEWYREVRPVLQKWAKESSLGEGRFE